MEVEGGLAAAFAFSGPDEARRECARSQPRVRAKIAWHRPVVEGMTLRGEESSPGESIVLPVPAADTGVAPVDSLPDTGLLALLTTPLATAPPVRIAVLVEWRAPTLFASRQLAALLAAPFLDVALVRVPATRARVPRTYAAYLSLCTRMAAHRDPLSRERWPGAVRDRPTIELPALARGTERVDVVLDLAASPAAVALAHAARCGLWRYRHGASSLADSCFAELERGHPLTRTRLVAWLADAAPRVLAEGVSATTRAANVTLNRAATYWATEHFALQALRELHGCGWEALRDRARALEGTPSGFDAAFASRPLTSGRVLRWAGQTVARRAARRLARAPTLTDWSIALRRCDAPLPERAPAGVLDGARFLPNPLGRFHADPFLVAHDGRTWLFVEDYAFDRARGAIACGELLADGTVVGLRTCLERPYHVSYPNVFWHEGCAWMVPESEQSGSVDLYRATLFPYEWRRERTLLRLRCVDPTPFAHAGRWWLYATHVPLRGVDAATVLFTAAALHGPWRLHARGAIVVDASRARCAGAPIVHAGRLLRPAQDGIRHYGRALVLNEVRRLTLDDYEEVPVRRFEAPAGLGLDGLHHYSRCGDWEAFDVRLQSPVRRFAERPVRDDAGRLPAVTLEPMLTPRR